MNRHGRGRGPMGIVTLLALGALGLPLAGTSSAAVAAPELRWERSVGLVRESSPTIADVDGDGLLDISFGDRNGNLWVLGPDGTPRPGWPQAAGSGIDSTPAVADTDGDGRAEVFVGTGTSERSTGALVSFRADGSRRFTFRAADRVFPSPSIHSSPAVGDVAGSATPDVSFGSLGLESIWALEQDGVRHRGFPFYADDTVFSSPALVDVDGDGRRDIVIGGDSTAGPPVDHRGGMVRAIRGDGRMLWEHRINDVVRGGPVVGDITGDGRPEIVFGAGDYYGGSDSFRVFALDLRGTPVPGWPRTTDGVVEASPTLADLDGDGRLDVVVGTRGGVNHKGVGGTVHAFDGSGRNLRGYPRASGGGVVIGTIATVDLEGDGHQDIIVPTGGGLFAYGGDDGAPRFALLQGKVSFQNQPAIADLDGDGRLDLVAVGGRPDGGSGAAYRWALPASARLGSLGWHQSRKDPLNTGSWQPAIPPSRTVAVERLQGPDRAATAAAVASAGITSVDRVLVATGSGYADALAAGPAAAVGNGVVLLTDRTALPNPTREALARLRPREVVVLGGDAVVSGSVLDQITTTLPGATVRRVAGSSRYDTAAQLSQESFRSPAVAYVASGEGYADALAGGAAAAYQAAPILLVRPGGVPAETAAAIRALAPGRLVVLGGAASVSDATFEQLRGLVPNIVRRGGADRWATAAAVSASVFPTAAAPMVASGAGYADALAAAPVAARRGVPLLLSSPRCVPSATRAEVERLGATRLALVGGPNALSSTIGALTSCP